MRGFVYCLLLFLLFYAAPIQAQDRMSLTTGFNLAGIRDQGLVFGDKPILAAHLGFSGQFSPFKQADSLFLEVGFMYSRLGYDQQLGRTYYFRFSYFTFQALAGYRLLKNMEVVAGFDLGPLLFTNVHEGTSTYRNVSFMALTGFTFMPQKTLSPYLRYSYGLLPLLDYYVFDALGNETGNTHAIRNWCLAAGLKINVR